MVLNPLCTIEAVLVAVCFLLLFLHQSAYADPLLITDDAGVSDKASCHLEGNVIYQPSTHSFSLSPICGLTDKLELGLGFTQTDQYNDHDQALSIQFKHNLKSVQSDSLSAAVSFTISHHLNGEGNSNWVLNIPLTYTFSDRLLFNTNVAYQQSNHPLILGAMSTSYLFTDKASLSVEIFNQDHQSAFYQTAIGYALIKNTLMIEASYADRFRQRQDRWIGFGLSYSPNF